MAQIARDFGSRSLAWLFRTGGPPQLASVTCGGAFDERTGNYADSVVVVALSVP